MLRLRSIAVWSLLIGAACASQVHRKDAAPTPGESQPVQPIGPQDLRFDTPEWKAIDQLVDEQKLSAARDKLRVLRTAAEKAGRTGDWTRALIRDVALGSALGELETAVRLMREAKWPDDAFSHLVLDLYYATTLINYVQVYDYEINQRERVVSRDVVDLKAWTREQIVDEALSVLQRVWSRREALSGPASIFGPYVKLNNYPTGVRDTLRDVLAYQLVELLANTEHWRPGEEQELFRVDHAALLAGHARDAQGQAVASVDVKVHPMVRVVAVLADTAVWHQQHGRTSAALEAELERLRRLHGVFTNEAQHKAQTTALSQLLDRTKDVAWWPMGQALLAQWAFDRDDRALARTLAQAAVSASPGSPGALACAQLIAQIEAPDLRVQGMLLDGPGRRSLAVHHRNLPQLHFRAYPFDVLARLGKRQELAPSREEVQTLLTKPPTAAWSVSLPDLGDYAEHQTFVTPPLKDPGAYVIVVSARPDFAPQQNRVDSAPLFIGRWVIRHRDGHDGSVEYSVLDGDTGVPVGDVQLSLYERDYRSGVQRLAAKTTDAEGRVSFGRDIVGGDRSRYLFAAAQRGRELSLAADPVWLSAPEEPREQSGAFVFTDRSVYRPQQTLHWKVLAYRGSDATWKNLTRKTLDVALHDANGDVVQKLSVKTNTYGTASGSFTIPAGRLLGVWEVRAGKLGSAAVRIEEYKRPTFEVELSPSREAAQLDHPVTLRGEAKYYFGLPVQRGQLRWKVERSERYPWWMGFWHLPIRPRQVIAAGESTLDDRGHFAFTFTPASDPDAKPELQFTYQVSVDLTDEGGETRSAARSFTLGKTSIDARLEPARGFVVAGEAAEVELHRTNLDGDPRPGRGRYRLLQLRQPSAAALPADVPLRRSPDDHRQHTPGDDQRRRDDPQYDADAVIATWEDGAELAAAEIDTGEDGRAKITLPKLGGGAYRLRYTSVDEHGGKLEVQRELLIADAQTRFALPALLKVEQSSIDSGGVARVLATSGLASQPLWLEIYADRKLVERRVLPVGGPALQEIKLGPERRGGIGLVLVGLRDYQALEQSGSVFVPWDDRTVQIELASFRDTLRPGQHETFRVRVHAADKARTPLLAAELLGYMYDRSLDVFAPHQPPNPLELYPRRTQTAHTRWGLGSSSGSMVFTRDPWFTLPEGVALHGDELDFPLAYSFGGPGRRGHGLGGGRYKLALQAAPMPVMSAPASSGARALSRSAAAPELAEAQIAADQDGKAAPPAAEQAAAAKEVRSNFAETAFFLPSLVTDNDGSATLEFTVPDSVTAWNVWVHAITRDFRFGTTRRETRSLKDLMVRPYLPRFLRELDDVALKVVVQNASKQPLSGELTFEAFDPATQQSLATELGVQPAKQPFTVAAESSTNLTVALKAPRRVGDVALRVVGKAGGLSDGELRTLPLLPSRLHLVQSKFATLRGEGSSRKLQLPDLSAHDDSSRQHEQLVVTVEAQLFMTVLKSLPFLIDYPYECSEQTLNRFLSAAIVARTFEKYPAVKRMAADLVKQRDRLLASFDAPDPNRVTQLEESPWLVESRGGPELDEHLLKVLDPPVAEKERDRALSRLQQLQHPDGSFPWFPGGRPSPYMTLYLLIGLSRAAEFDVAVPRELVHRAWGYMAEHFRTDLGPQLAKRELSPEIATLLAYATSGFPDPSWLANAFTKEQLRQVLDYAFSRWKELPPLLKAALSTALIRAQRKPDAKLVWDSVMDSAKTTEDEGTFWKPEDYSWLWYHDTIETHAFAVRTQLELGPEDPKLDGLVVWLLLNKKLNHWKSTRATAEVIYSLVKYLDHKSALGSREVVTVGIGNQPKRELVFEPDRYTGKSQVRIAGADVRPEMATIQVDKRGAGVAFASATWHYATDKLPEEGRGDLFQVRRTYFRREAMGAETKLVPLADNTLLHPGDEVEVQLEISARASAEYIHLRDPRAAGLEPPIGVSGYHFDRGLAYYEEIRDSGHNFFIEWMPAGQYTLRYRLRANLPGHFRVGPATLQSMYAPEFSAFSAGHGIAIE